jgi:hypothetical protein
MIASLIDPLTENEIVIKKYVLCIVNMMREFFQKEVSLGNRLSYVHVLGSVETNPKNHGIRV